MNYRNNLAFKLNLIIDNYKNNNNIERFYKKINDYNNLISLYINNELYENYKNDKKKVYDNIINYFLAIFEG